jgi:hypothetical protein
MASRTTGGMALEGEAQLISLGENEPGKAFVALAVGRYEFNVLLAGSSDARATALTSVRYAIPTGFAALRNMP